MARPVDGSARKSYPGGRGKTGFRYASGSYVYEDVFSDELSGLPLHNDVDFCIELHPGTSPISMTLHRMASVEL